MSFMQKLAICIPTIDEDIHEDASRTGVRA